MTQTGFASSVLKRAFANVAVSQTDSSLVTAVSGRKIRVVGLFVSGGGTATAVTLNSKGAGAGTAISSAISSGVNSQIALPYNPAGWFETNTGEALTVTTGAGSTTGINVSYVEVSP